MFNVIEKNQKLVKGIMIAVTASFVVWGIGGYLGMAGDDGYVAKVGSNKIYTQDIDQAMQNNPQNTDKMQILFGLINRQLLINNIDNYHMIATTEQMQQDIAAIPQFQNSKGQFDLKLYETFLRERVMTADQFQKSIGQQIVIKEFLDLFQNGYFSSKEFDKSFAKLLSRQRNVTSYAINTQQFLDKVNVTDAQIDSYYKQNIARFTLPEKVKLQYLVLDPTIVATSINISDKELNKYIKEHKVSSSAEQIDVSHILLTVPQGATPEAKAAVKARAEKLLAEVKANPNKFAQIAKENSQDPGSAKNGGDLGLFGRGVMVKPFEDAAFNLKPGQISNIVETQYGYHILKLNKIQGNTPDAVRTAAITQLQKQKATSVVQKQLEQLTDLTYNQASSLDPAAKKLGLQLQTSPDWVTKGTISGDFANPKIQAAIFNPDVIDKHNNSEVVDLNDGSHAVYRVTEYQKSKVQTLAEVKEQIKQQLKQQTAASMAADAGQKQLLTLQQGKAQLQFSKPENVTLLGQSPDINNAMVKQIFATSIKKLPAYTGGIDNKGNYIIYKINNETIDPKLDTQNQAVISQLDTANAMVELSAYVGSLRNKYSVDYKVDRLNLQSK